MSKERLEYLFKVYTNGTATPEERKAFLEWIQKEDDKSFLKDNLQEIYQEDFSEDTFSEVNWDKMYQGIYDDAFKKKREKIRAIRRDRLRWLKIAGVIALIVALEFGRDKIFNKDSDNKDIASVEVNPIKTVNNVTLKIGRSQAILNGKDTSFILDDNKVNVSEGRVAVAENKVEMFTLSTPRGKTYKVQLSDGTLVWLNAKSELIYPSAFTGDKRTVTVKGEAYFEVAEDAHHPFIVQAAGQKVKVLGTRFNIEAYQEDENVITTLVSGKIKVNVNQTSALLKPGEQTKWNGAEDFYVNDNVDMEQVLAWKNGYFRFKKAKLHSIMQVLSRWYDIKVHFSPDLKTHHFGFIVNRDNDLSEILTMLAATNEVSFKIKGKDIFITPPIQHPKK